MMMLTVLLLIITAGRWVIGDRLTENGGVGTVASAGDLWPHKVMSWVYFDISGKVESDPQLTVTGNINILCLILILYHL